MTFCYDLRSIFDRAHFGARESCGAHILILKREDSFGCSRLAAKKFLKAGKDRIGCKTGKLLSDNRPHDIAEKIVAHLQVLDIDVFCHSEQNGIGLFEMPFGFVVHCSLYSTNDACAPLCKHLTGLEPIHITLASAAA